LNNDKFSEDEKHISMQKEGILVIRPLEIELRTKNVFSFLVNQKNNVPPHPKECDFQFLT